VGRVAIVGSNHVLEQRQWRPGAEGKDSGVEPGRADQGEDRQLRPPIESTEEVSALNSSRNPPEAPVQTKQLLFGIAALVSTPEPRQLPGFSSLHVLTIAERS